MSSLKPIGYAFTELQSVDSTNNYAMGMVHAGMAQHGIAVFTHDQTKGRGQRQKQWLSEPGTNIAISLIIQPAQLSTSQLFMLSKSVALGVHQFFNRYATDETSIKWPNDLYWRDRKAGGILIENVIQGSEWKYSVAGIGININQTSFPDLETRPVSLRQITGTIYSPLELAKELCRDVDQWFTTLLYNPELVSKDYSTRLFRLNQVTRFRRDGRVFDATVRGVTDDGRLIVEHGVEEFYEVGEVEWVI